MIERVIESTGDTERGRRGGGGGGGGDSLTREIITYSCSEKLFLPTR